MENVKDIKKVHYSELINYLDKINEKKFRADQIFDWLYNSNISSFDDMTNISNKLKKKLTNDYCISIPTIEDKIETSDGTVKFLLKYDDEKGEYTTECVAMKNKTSFTACISSQSGCPLNCKFCSTGKIGFTRNLSLGNIIDQINIIKNELDCNISNIVFMGQGEPFLNYQNVIESINIINNKKFFNIGARKITISTSGIIPAIKDFTRLNEQYKLAISLHSANQKKRNILMPGVRKYNLTELKKTLLEYQSITNRRITFEYIMIKDINDSEDDLLQLLIFCKHIKCHINLIPYNESKGNSFKTSSMSTINYWKDLLKNNYIETTVRNSKGSKIAAACGQLASNQ